MTRLHEWYLRARRRDEGATAVEYGVMVALIAAVIIAVVVVVGQQVKGGFCDVNAGLVDPGFIGSKASDCA